MPFPARRRSLLASLTTAASRWAGSAARKRRPRGAQIADVEALESRLALAQTVGLFVNDPAAQVGYTLFNDSFSPTTHLVDNNGQEVHTWTGSGGATSVYLQDDGSILRNTMLAPPQRSFGNNGATGKIELIDWNNQLTWSYTLANAQYQLHHDSILLPNGNVLAIAWERLSSAQAVAMGRDPALLNPAVNKELWPEAILEIKPDLVAGSGGQIVWEWHMKDHVIQSYDAGKPSYVKASEIVKNPQLINLNFIPRGLGADANLADWAHFNAIDFNPVTNQILVSSREFSEVWMIDHSTTTAQAASHSGGTFGKGGDLLWRYGNPQTWNAGGAGSQTLEFQHNIQWIDDGLPGAGNLLVFNNGWGRPDGSSWSQVMELKPLTYGLATVAWSYGGPTKGFFSPIISGAQRLANGDTLIDEGSKGRIFEVTSAGKIVWQYINPDVPGGPLTQGATPALVNISGVPGVQANLTFRALRYTANSPALAGRTLTPGKLVEKYPPFFSTVGSFDSATKAWTLNHHADGTSTAITRIAPLSGATAPFLRPLTGDFDGDGLSSPAVYDAAAGAFRIDNDADGVVDQVVTIPGARSTWLPLAGNWDGQGGDEVGLYEPTTHTFRFYALDGSEAAKAFITLALPASWRPVAGDWNGDGKDSVGLYDPVGHTFYLNNRIDGSITDMTTFKTPALPSSWVPLVGDWDGNKKDTVGLFDPVAKRFYLNNRIDGSTNNMLIFSLPMAATAIPVTGNWGSFPAAPRPAVAPLLKSAPMPALLAPIPPEIAAAAGTIPPTESSTDSAPPGSRPRSPR